MFNTFLFLILILIGITVVISILVITVDYKKIEEDFDKWDKGEL